MTNTNVIVSSPNLKGDITSCKLEQQEIRVDRKSVFSLQEKHTYVSYDVCNKQVVEQYTLPRWTDLASSIPMVIFGVVIVWWMFKEI
jgi:hypothetical protein